MAHGGGRIGVAEGLQALPGGLRGQPDLAGTQLRERVQQRAVEQLLVQPPHLHGVPPPLGGQLGDRVGAEAQ